MLNVDRQKEIYAALLRYGSVKVADLSEKYQVQNETIRRDLKILAKQCEVKLVYGGAYLNTVQAVKERTLSLKRTENYEAKQIIAQKAAALIEEGDTIGLNSGSTVEYILDYLGNKRVSILTLNVNIATKALLLANVDIYIPGGPIRKSSGMVIGPTAIDFIKSFSLDKCFFGISALSIQRGVMHPVVEEVASNVALMAISKDSYVVTDSSKMDKTSLFSMIDVDSMSNIITDDNIPPEYREFFTSKNITVL